MPPVYGWGRFSTIVPSGKRRLSFRTLSARTMARWAFWYTIQLPCKTNLPPASPKWNTTASFPGVHDPGHRRHVCRHADGATISAPVVDFIPFTVLLIIHVILHWYLERIIPYRFGVLWYIIIQGILAILISWLGGSLGIIFAVFMALLGEAVGLYGLTRRGLLAGVYYLVLLLISFVQFSGWEASGWLMVGTLPMALFVVIYVLLYVRRWRRKSAGACRGTGNRQPPVDRLRRPGRGPYHCQRTPAHGARTARHSLAGAR